jgi:hypothetical protein
VMTAATLDAAGKWSALAAEERLPFLVCWPHLLPGMPCLWSLEAVTRHVRSVRARSLQAECCAAAGPAWRGHRWVCMASRTRLLPPAPPLPLRGRARSYRRVIAKAGDGCMAKFHTL